MVRIFHIFNYYAFQKLSMLLLKSLQSVTLVDPMVEVLLKELESSAVFFDYLAPGFHSDRDVVAAGNESESSFWMALQSKFYFLVILVGDWPKMPSKARNSSESRVVCNGRCISF